MPNVWAAILFLILILAKQQQLQKTILKVSKEHSKEKKAQI